MWNEAAPGTEGGPRLGANGRVLANGWVHKGIYADSWQEMQGFLRKSVLAGRRLKWPHPRQSWYVASRPEHEAAIDELSRTIRPPRPGWIKGRSA